MKNAARLLLGLVVSGLCLWLVLSGLSGSVSIDNMLEKIGKVDVLWVCLALGSIILSYPLNTLRLKYILMVDEAFTCNFFPVLSIVWASAFFSLAMPSTAFSDGFRVALLRTSRISNLSLAVRAVLIDRAMGLIYMVGLAGIVLLVLPKNLALNVSNYWGLIFLLVFLGATAMLFLGSAVVNKIQLFVRLRTLFNGMRQLMSNPRSAVLFLGFAVANAIVSALGLWCIARGFNVDISFWVFFVFTPVILTISNLPIFYQGFGGREAAMLFAFGGSPLVITPDLVLTISLVSGAVMIVAALIGSVFVPFLLSRRK